MNKSLIALALVSVFAAPAFADEAPVAVSAASPHTVTANVTLASDYIFRGISQSQPVSYTHLDVYKRQISSPGIMPDKRAASMDFPEPGGPTISSEWFPAAAISSARLACA